MDQEGGSVARLGSPFTQLPPMAKLGKYYQKTKDTRAIKQVGCLLGRELRAVGFNWDFAPVVDVHSNPKNPVIGQRAFDPNPRVVTLCAAALIKGLHEEGVLSCAKHFPGHGATSVDSHKDLPILRSAGRLLWKRDVFPYRKLMEKRCLPCIMTAHVRYTELDSHSCATLSELIITGILRKRMGYRGLVVSDDFQMKAIADRYDLSEAAFKFFMAGGDMAMICKDPEAQIEAIERVKKQVSKDKFLRKKLEKSFRRIQRIKKRFCSRCKGPSTDVIGCAEHRRVVEKILGHSRGSCLAAK